MNVEMETETDAGPPRPEAETVEAEVRPEVEVSRVVLDNPEASAEYLNKIWAEQDKYIDLLEARLREKGRTDTSRREQLLVMRLTAKEQELQEMAAQIAELKAAQAPTNAQLRQTLLDPAVNLVIQRLTKECDKLKKEAEEAQNELAAWKFTPDSATGKRLMAKCRQLYQENEDLGKMIASGRLAKLEGELSLQKNLSEEMKKNQLEMDEFMAELDEDVEGMQSTIYYLQQQLREAKETIAKLESQTGDNLHQPEGETSQELKPENEVQNSEEVATQEEVDQEDKVEAVDAESVTEDTKSEKEGRGRGRGNKNDADGKPELDLLTVFTVCYFR